MGSMQDQLLQAGLITEDKLKQAKAKDHKARKRAGKAKKSKRKQPNSAPAGNTAELAAKRAKDRQLNRVRDSERGRKSRLTALRTLLDKHRKNDPKGDIKHYYQSGKKIKYLYITPKQQTQLQQNKLLIAVLEGRGHILEQALEKQLASLDPDNQDIRIARVADSAGDAGNDYGDHPVPDDLMW